MRAQSRGCVAIIVIATIRGSDLLTRSFSVSFPRGTIKVSRARMLRIHRNALFEIDRSTRVDINRRSTERTRLSRHLALVNVIRILIVDYYAGSLYGNRCKRLIPNSAFAGRLRTPPYNGIVRMIKTGFAA